MTAIQSIKPVTGVLLDISGVLKDGMQVVPRSVQAFRKLQESGMPMKLLTNETQETQESIASSLLSMGFEVLAKDIIPPCPAVVQLLKAERLRPYLLVHPNVLPEFGGIDQNSPNCVVVGDAAENFTYQRMTDAFRVLIDAEHPRLFTLGRGKYYKLEDCLVLDVGPFATALEYAANVKAEVIGKPQKEYFAAALKELGKTAQDVVMVGDDLLHDVGGAQNCGLQGILVRTGKFRPSDENHPVVKPDAVVNDLADAVHLILGSSI